MLNGFSQIYTYLTLELNELFEKYTHDLSLELNGLSQKYTYVTVCFLQQISARPKEVRGKKVRAFWKIYLLKIYL